MATAFGPQRPVDASGLQNMDEPVARSIPVTASLDDSASSKSPFASPQPSPRNMAFPPPNPHFVFPARPASSSSSAPSSFSRATGRRPRSAIESQEHPTQGITGGQNDGPARSPALPAFSFNPGASLPPDPNSTLLSPPLSPLSPHSPLPIPSPSRPGGHGHKRGGSEFVGGNIRAGEAITVMSTSPTKSESGFASPTFQPPPRPAGRRGHAHRRSAAISSHDLSLILQPPNSGNIQRGSSAPTSPAEFDRRLDSPPLDNLEKTLKTAESEPMLKRPEELEQPTADGEVIDVKVPSPSKPTGRARVGFSDTLEYIPRPLSLVSSDTSSTVTARPGHSVSGSISSIMSNTTATNVVDEDPIASVAASPKRQSADSRPSTAGAVLERSQSIQSVDRSGSSPRRRNSIPALISVPGPGTPVGPDTPSPSKTPKRWSFFGLEPFAASGSPTRSRPLSSSSTESVSKPSNSASSSSDAISDPPADSPDANHPLHQKRGAKKTNKKKKKVKNWAGSILTRKTKPRPKKGKDASLRSNSPPLPSASSNPADEQETMFEEVQRDLAVEPVTPTVLITDSSSPTQASHPWKPRSVSTPEDEASFPMIDLDAALGPFNTPLARNPEWEAAQKAAGNTKRQLHSAQGMKGFSGPGMHYHRRAESAPEMVPFESGRFIHRFGSSSTMADVFEEDEEDDDHTGKTTPLEDTVAGEVDSDCSSDDATPPATTHPKGLRSELPSRSSQDSVRLVGLVADNADHAKPVGTLVSERSKSSLREEAIGKESRTVEFRNTNFHEKSDGTGSATPSPRRVMASRDLPPVEISPLHLPTPSHVPISPYSMSHASSFPSPRSPMSYDAQRISTAPSSVNEENNFQSLLLGEPGPEVRISVDDIPSLTSSNSTMTRESLFSSQNPQFSQIPFRPDQRPASVSSAAFGRRRSSLASLSRLISSSHGERSKLSMEVPLDGDADKKKQKSSRSKRLSRMMQFWRPSKETSTS